MIKVPDSYNPPNGCKYKARSLQYALEQRKKRGEINSRIWIFLLDEESFITEQTLSSLVKYIEQPTPKPVAEGPIIYPNKFFKNIITSFGECMRPYICYDCVYQMTSGKGPLHMHGSNLLVRSDIEALVGWDHYLVDASEDQRFGWEAHRLLGDIFGWHGGLIEEQPPFRIKDYIRQRRRWFVGNVHNMIYSKVRLRKKIHISFRWSTWSFGFLAGLVSFFALVIPQAIPDILRLPLLLNTFVWAVGYQIGLRHNLEPIKLSKLKKVLLHFAMLILTPLIGLIETYAAFTAPKDLRNFKRIPTPKY